MVEKMTVTRIDFANKLRENFGLTATDAYKLVDLVFAEIEESLIRGEEVKFATLGSFKILDKAARMGRNPKTGEPALISARRVVSFRPSTGFRNKIKNAK
jgi:integration host factor subunit alpha